MLWLDEKIKPSEPSGSLTQSNSNWADETSRQIESFLNAKTWQLQAYEASLRTLLRAESYA
jgi:hypothetical protein